MNWADFLRSQADALLACDFFETVALSGARLYVFVLIEHTDRRIRILGVTAHPTTSWVVRHPDPPHELHDGEMGADLPP
ncbi:hypothetical protein [Streptomyces sp. NBC_01451]|uniref:hypothetical protein n=1 Tax=Streptomyces sp. NBC_01451 TaxID=2903872 RepID=UPI003FCC94CC